MVCATITPLLKGASARWKRKSDVYKPPQGGCAQVKILWRTSRNQMGRCCRNNELMVNWNVCNLGDLYDNLVAKTEYGHGRHINHAIMNYFMTLKEGRRDLVSRPKWSRYQPRNQYGHQNVTLIPKERRWAPWVHPRLQRLHSASGRRWRSCVCIIMKILNIE